VTLFDIVKKNIRGNFKSYLVYFMSMLISVVIYYTFVSLQYSTEIAKSIEASQSMQSIFMVASIILILFEAVFILYSNNFFARKRKKEVGLYSLLGLRKKDVGKMMFYENLIMGAIVLVVGIAVGTFLSKLFTMILLKLLGTTVDVGMTFSLSAVANTVIMFAIIILFTSIQGYRLIYKFKLIELFRAECEGEHEPKASVISAILAVLCLVIGYWFAFQNFSNNKEIITNLGVMLGGIIIGTALLFSSLVIFLLKMAKRNKGSYYKGMNLVGISNLVYRIKGNSRTLCVISLLNALALCSVSVGFGLYYGFDKTARLTAPFSYMYIAQDKTFNKTVDSIIRADKEHPVSLQMEIHVIKCKGEASSSDILSGRDIKADENPIKVVSISQYNLVAQALKFPMIDDLDDGKAIAIRPMYTNKKSADYEGESITLKLPKEDITFAFAGMTIERIINWSFPDIMIVINDNDYKKVQTQVSPITYVGYSVQNQKTTKKTADKLATIKTSQSKVSTYYSVYRLGIEEASFNVFILGFLAIVFMMATGSILYFKQLTEAHADKARYKILAKIGVNKKEIYLSILMQNAFIFVLPFMVGLAHYIVILNLLKKMFSGMAGVNLTLPILVCVSAFTLIYAVYYIITVNSINKAVIGESAPMIKFATVVIGVCVLVLFGMLIWFASLPPKEENYVGEKIYLDLPKPTGQYLVGTTELHLRDENRVDPWVSDMKRELMISIWYPAEQESNKKAHYMQPGAAKHYDENTISKIGLDPGRINLVAIGTNAWLDAPVAFSQDGWPIILYSPGASVPRNFGTVLVEELASRGYVVVTVDHTYDASAVEFPDGRVLTEKLPENNAEVVLKMLDTRVKDMRYILDMLESIKAGSNPDYEQRELPMGLAKALNLSKIGIFGHSAGGATAAQTMYDDNRIDAGIDMDGSLGYVPDHLLPVAHHGLDRPFMLMNSGYYKNGNEPDSHLTAPDRKSFWQNSNGWKLDLSVPKGMHYTFTDYQFLLPMLDEKLSIPPQVIQNLLGTTDPNQMLDEQRNYISAFFDLHLKGIEQPLLLSPSKLYPEVEFVR